MYFRGSGECTPGMGKVIHLQLVPEGEQEGVELQSNERQRLAVKVCLLQAAQTGAQAKGPGLSSTDMTRCSATL